VYNNFAKLTAHLGHWHRTLRQFIATGQELGNSLPVQGDAFERRRPSIYLAVRFPRQAQQARALQVQART
jgi:hypothetical protein